MFEPYLLSHPLLVAGIWVVLYTSDYYLTLYGAKLRAAQSVFLTEGSYELTPDYQKDIDAGNKRSFTFLVWLIAGAAMLLVPLLVADCPRWLYGLLVGYVVFVELGVHLRHVSNVFTYGAVLGPRPTASGRVLFARRGVYERSALDLATLGVFTLLVYGLTGSFVLLGGGLRLMREGYRHWRLSKVFPLPSPTDEAGDLAPLPDDSVRSPRGMLKDKPSMTHDLLEERARDLERE